MIQLVLAIIIYLILVIPVGRYLYHIAAESTPSADPVFDRLDGVIYKISGIHPHKGMNLEAIRTGACWYQRGDDWDWLLHLACASSGRIQPK